MALSREDLRNQLRTGEILPIYVLYGEETNLRDLAAKTIADRAFSENDFRDFNISEFNLSNEDKIKEAIAAAEQLPMMSARRVVLIKNVRISQSGRGDTIKEDHEDLLKSYFGRPASTSVVIFIADELNGVRKMGKFLRSSDGAVEFTTLGDADLAERAGKQFADAGVRIDRAALNHLIAVVGPDTSRLSNEVEKLIAASFPDRIVTVELIGQLISQTRELGSFALTNSIAHSSQTVVLETLRQSLNDGAEPVMLIGSLGAHYRKMFIAAEMMSRGADKRDVDNAVRLPWEQKENLLRKARQMGVKKLSLAISRIAAADLALKTSIGGSGPAASRMQIEKLVCELVSL